MAHKTLTFTIYPLADRAIAVTHDYHPAVHLPLSAIPFILVWVNLVFSSPFVLYSNAVTQCSPVQPLIVLSNPAPPSMTDLITCKISLL